MKNELIRWGYRTFYKKQSMRYQMYAKASGRKGFLEDTWGED